MPPPKSGFCKIKGIHLQGRASQGALGATIFITETSSSADQGSFMGWGSEVGAALVTSCAWLLYRTDLHRQWNGIMQAFPTLHYAGWMATIDPEGEHCKLLVSSVEQT